MARAVKRKTKQVRPKPAPRASKKRARPKPATSRRIGKGAATIEAARTTNPSIEFRTIVADPPWAFGDKLPGETRGAQSNYRTMRVGDIELYLERTLEEQGFRIAPDALLFLWRVAAMQEEACGVMRVWGFDQKSEMVWHKTTQPVLDGGEILATVSQGQRSDLKRSLNRQLKVIDGAQIVRPAFGMGRYVRNNHEVCLIGRRGENIIQSRSVRSTFFAPLGEHSEKPEAFYQAVEQLAPGPYLELFGRKKRAGWTVLGDQAR